MKFPKQAELDRLVNQIQRHEALNHEELLVLTQLNAELATWKTDCIKVVDEIVSQIVAYDITLEQLLSRQELRHWVMSPAPAAGTSAGVMEGAQEKKRRTRTANPELVIFKIQPQGAKGAPTAIHRGELPAKMGAKLQWLLQREGDLESNLMACVDSDEARAYLANEEGRIFFEKLLNWIKSQQP